MTQSTLETSIKKHLSQDQLPDFGGYLLAKIMSRLNYEKQIKALRPKLWAAAGLFLGSLILLILTADFSWHAFIQTPTFQYISLVFTDFGQVAANWQDYGFSILESLPLAAVTSLAGALLVSILLIDFSKNQLSNFRKLLNDHSYGQH